MVIFVFSKKKCDEYSQTLSNFDFCTATEKSEIHTFIEKSLRRIKGKDDQHFNMCANILFIASLFFSFKNLLRIG